MGTQKVWKWVGDACPVDMGQLNHCVVLGTKSGAVQDFQWGKKCPSGVKIPKNAQKQLKKPNPKTVKMKIEPYLSPMMLMIISDGKEWAENTLQGQTWWV